MKPVSVLVSLLLLIVIFPVYLAAEIEPNNDITTANYINLNSYETGFLGDPDNYDWYAVTLSVDGELTVQSTSESSVEIDITIYDNILGYSSVTYGGLYGTIETAVKRNCAAGIYYIKLYRWSGQGTYNIIANFIPASLSNDPSNNDSASVASVLPLNGFQEGHLGYTYDGYQDVYDWWKITLPSDGALTIRTESDSTAEIDLYIYDDSGENMLAGYAIGWGPVETTSKVNIKSGTYRVKAYRWSGYGCYTISSEFTPANFENDLEPNDELGMAQLIFLNQVVSGHLGFSDATQDIADYFQFTLPSNMDSLFIRMEAEPTGEFDLALQHSNGASYVTLSSWGPVESTVVTNVNAGNYIIKIYRWSGFGPYLLKVSTEESSSLTNSENPEIKLPEEFTLYQNYPNPFNPSTTIQFYLPEQNEVLLEILNSIGQRVAVVINEHLNRGLHALNFDAENLSSGIYYYRITNGFLSQTKKMIILK